jgi:hypothetical protein
LVNVLGDVTYTFCTFISKERSAGTSTLLMVEIR